MPIVNKVKGNLISLAKTKRYSAIAHGCNCYCTMGSGIAPQIADNFKGVREADNETIKGDPVKLGSYSLAFDPSINLEVYNLYTQFGYGTHKRQVDYDAITLTFQKLNYLLSRKKLKADYHLGIPKIGSDLAGGNWDIISDRINKATPDIKIELVIYDPSKK